MSKAKEFKDRVARTKAHLEKPDTLDIVCAHVANGGCLVDLCELQDLRYSDVIAWLYADPARKTVYESAMIARGEWFVQSFLREMKAIGMADIRQAFGENGNLKDIAQLPPEIARAVSSVEVYEERDDKTGELTGWTKKVKFWDKLKALELLGKKLSWFIERHEHTGKVTLEELVAGSTDGTVTPAADTSGTPA